MRTEDLSLYRNNEIATGIDKDNVDKDDNEDITDDDSDNFNLDERKFCKFPDPQRTPLKVPSGPVKGKLRIRLDNILNFFKKTSNFFARNEIWQTRDPHIIGRIGIIVVIVVILFCVLLKIYYSDSRNIQASYFNKDNTDDLKYLEDQFEDNFRKMSIIFPTQPKSYWEKFKHFIRRVIDKKDPKPAVFILLHDGHRDTAHCIASHIGHAASLRLANSHIPASLNISFTYQLNDYYDITSIFKKELEEKAAMVIYDLEKFPANIAQNFHALCDVYNPVVRKSVFVFTLDSENCKYLKHEKKKASLIMESVWASLDDATLPPLITRLTENVVQIHPEPSVINPSCGLT